jgi:hypothetical protein
VGHFGDFLMGFAIKGYCKIMMQVLNLGLPNSQEWRLYVKVFFKLKKFVTDYIHIMEYGIISSGTTN